MNINFPEECAAFIDEYEYLLDHTRLGVWTLDGDPSHVNLLRFSLTEDNFTDTTVVFTVSMTTPWNIMDQLQTWASMLQDHIDKLALSAERTKGLQRDSEWQYIQINSTIRVEWGQWTRDIEKDLNMKVTRLHYRITVA